MRGQKRIDLTGQKFGKLTVIKFSHTTDKYTAMWECLCSCGNITVARSQSLREGRLNSCGCLVSEVAQKVNLTHGHSINGKVSLTMRSWSSMKQRCYNPKGTHFNLYGGKGIKVCNRWIKSFENFLKDMGERPSTLHSLDRKNSNKNYTKSNCRWATKKEQAQNTSRNVFIIFNGKKIVQAEFCRLFGIKEANFSAMSKCKGLTETISFYTKKYAQ